MTDKAIEAAAKTLFENTPIVGNRSWQWCCDKLPALAEKWRVCARASIAAYENTRWDEAIGRYREVLDRQRNRQLPPPPGKEG